MAIIRLGDKYKSKQNVQLTPSRTYISSSSGITGSVHVFPNRSITQKDNIDERLELAPMVEEGTEFSGTPIRPYDSNSLEARRIEIYEGQFGKLIGGMFADALQYEYNVIVPGDTNLNGKYTGELINDEIENDPNWDLYDSNNGYFKGNAAAATATRTADGVVFTYRSDDRWEDQFGDIFNKLPESDRDNNGKSFEIALGLLLDGAHPFAEDHAWRKGVIQRVADSEPGFNIGNSSATSASTPSQKAYYQFTGNKIFTDELGIPYLDGPLTNQSEINAWPPEVAKWNSSIITNFVVQGYSDLSMHPRNATKKEILRKRANHNVFSSGSLYQKVLANRIEDLEPIESGWWVHNNNALCLSQYDTDNKTPALCYSNSGGRYLVNWQSDKVTFEFWIKPCAEQLETGTVCHLPGNYAICLVPDQVSKVGNEYENYRIGFYVGTRAARNQDPGAYPSASVKASGSNDGYYITRPLLKKNTWHHVVIRFGANFNNGLLNVYIDGNSETDGNIDGIHNPTLTPARSDGFVNTTLTSAADTSLIVGGWSPNDNMASLYGQYGLAQEHPSASSSPVYSAGFNLEPIRQLKSELGDFRIWSTCRSELEITTDKFKTLRSLDDIKCYINFQFDPRDSSPVWNHKGFVPAVKSDTSSDYYERGTLVDISTSNLVNNYNKVQFCTNSAYIVGMPFVNVHSHLREYKHGEYPIITQFGKLTDTTDATLYPTINNLTTANDKLNYFINNWESLKWLQCMNSMIVPCDNTLFEQAYSLNSKNYHKGTQDYMLRLEGTNISNTNDQYEIKHFLDDEVFTIQDAVVTLDPDVQVFGGKEENYQTAALISNQKLVDLDFISPVSTVFSIPQIYYGNRIDKESLTIKFKINEDNKTITIKDYDGTLYRMDTLTNSYSTKVGHVDYGTGIVCIFSPLLVNVGLHNFEIYLKGQKNMHVMQLDIPCGEGIANKSQNPTYKKLKASLNSNESDGNVTYISTIYLHDDNLNIVGKVNLTKPVQKREEDSFIFRVKVDF